MQNVLVVEKNGLFRDLLINYLSKNAIKIADIWEKIPNDLVQSYPSPEFNVVILNPACLDCDIMEINGNLENLPNLIAMLDHNYQQNIDHFYNIGFKGVLCKNDQANELLKCISFVMEGKLFQSVGITNLVLDNKKKIKRSDNLFSTLTKRELEISKLILDFKSNREIAKELFISYKTVKNHKSNISDKLGCKGRKALLKFLFKNKSWLIEFPDH